MEVAVRMEALGSEDTEETILLGISAQMTFVFPAQFFCFRPIFHGL